MLPMTRAAAGVLAATLLTACASKPLSIRRPSGRPPVARVCDLALTPGIDVYVELTRGATARGPVRRLTCDVLELVPAEDQWPGSHLQDR
jgi:hypothetical protein